MPESNPCLHWHWESQASDKYKMQGYWLLIGVAQYKGCHYVIGNQQENRDVVELSSECVVAMGLVCSLMFSPTLP
jgi:hypothetical protein